ncbi:Copine-2 [Seminavis robusta]|uniref:Copine-2 n=1 Tax=Seminavis robusta TaxID=568900 RepID=A0A9N8EU56_9STRA|nr:Copine-2 [Seminavis robusta]|eukprot:Sro2180_g317950.1 Copine-2 (1258) ;mRNA; f:2495-6268
MPAIETSMDLHLILEGRDFRAVAGWFCTTDPVFTISVPEIRPGGSASWSTVYVSKKATDNLSPRWSEACIPLEFLCNGYLERPCRITVKHWDDNSEHIVIGFADLTVQDLLEASGVPSKAIQLQLEGEVEGHGSVVVRHARLQRPLREGWMLDARKLLTGDPSSPSAVKPRATSVFRLTLEGTGLDGGWFSVANPFYELRQRRSEKERQSEGDDCEWKLLHRSETVNGSLDPIWKSAAIPMLLLCHGEGGLKQPIRISCFNDTGGGQATSIGSFDTTVLDLHLAAGTAKKCALKSKEGHTDSVVRVIEATLPDEGLCNMNPNQDGKREWTPRRQSGTRKMVVGPNSAPLKNGSEHLSTRAISPRSTLPVCSFNSAEEEMLVTASHSKQGGKRDHVLLELPIENTLSSVEPQLQQSNGAALASSALTASLAQIMQKNEDLVAKNQELKRALEEAKTKIAFCEQLVVTANKHCSRLKRDKDDLILEKTRIQKELRRTKQDAATKAMKLNESIQSLAEVARRGPDASSEQLLTEKDSIIERMKGEFDTLSSRLSRLKVAVAETTKNRENVSDLFSEECAKAVVATHLAATNAAIRNKLGELMADAEKKQKSGQISVAAAEPNFHLDHGPQSEAFSSAENCKGSTDSAPKQPPLHRASSASKACPFERASSMRCVPSSTGDLVEAKTKEVPESQKAKGRVMSNYCKSPRKPSLERFSSARSVSSCSNFPASPLGQAPSTTGAICEANTREALKPSKVISRLEKARSSYHKSTSPKTGLRKPSLQHSSSAQSVSSCSTGPKYPLEQAPLERASSMLCIPLSSDMVKPTGSNKEAQALKAQNTGFTTVKQTFESASASTGARQKNRPMQRASSIQSVSSHSESSQGMPSETIKMIEMCNDKVAEALHTKNILLEKARSTGDINGTAGYESSKSGANLQNPSSQRASSLQPSCSKVPLEPASSARCIQPTTSDMVQTINNKQVLEAPKEKNKANDRSRSIARGKVNRVSIATRAGMERPSLQQAVSSRSISSNLRVQPCPLQRAASMQKIDNKAVLEALKAQNKNLDKERSTERGKVNHGSCTGSMQRLSLQRAPSTLSVSSHSKVQSCPLERASSLQCITLDTINNKKALEALKALKVKTKILEEFSSGRKMIQHQRTRNGLGVQGLCLQSASLSQSESSKNQSTPKEGSQSSNSLKEMTSRSPMERTNGQMIRRPAKSLSPRPTGNMTKPATRATLRKESNRGSTLSPKRVPSRSKKPLNDS